MKIQYKMYGDGAEIVRCCGTVPKIVLPERIAGYPVRKVAAYTFSARKAGEDTDVLVYESEEDILFREDERLLAGERIEEVVFPDTVEEIGDYIFYNCKSLKRLEFTDSLTHIGSGAFTGCGSLELLRVHLKRGKKSCVREILGDLWQRMDVIFYNEQACFFDGQKNFSEEARAVKLVFPEHYEEAVENTPARILFTRHHGIGNNYRQCFYSREPDYRKYDGLFPLAMAQDRPEVLADLVFARLTCPYELTAEHEKMYETYIREHPDAAARFLIERDDPALLQCMSDRNLWTREGLEEAIGIAAEKGKPEILSYLMNEKHLLFPDKKVKRFEL